MKSFMKLFAIAVAVMTLASCNETVEEEFIYSVSNSDFHLTQKSDMASVMHYAETHVKMGAESVMRFTGTEAEADKAAKSEFAKRLQAINEQEFCAMIAEGDYYDFILFRSTSDPNNPVEVDRKHYAGTRQSN